MFCLIFAKDEDVIQICDHKKLMNDHKISSIILMKVVGELVKPKEMTNHSKRPYLNLKEIFHASIYSNWYLVIT